MRQIFILIYILSFGSYAESADKLEKITNMDEFSSFIHTYYIYPQPELLNDAIKFLGASGLASKGNAKAPLLASFSCLFSIYDSTKKQKWQSTINRLEEPAKSLLNTSIKVSPAELFKSTPLSPAKNDMNWACFFATGELQYLDGISFTLKYLEERNDMNLLLTAASAKWSLSSNAKNHLKVQVYLEAMKTGDVSEMRQIAEDILGEEPQKIREETVNTLKE